MGQLKSPDNVANVFLQSYFRNACLTHWLSTKKKRTTGLVPNQTLRRGFCWPDGSLSSSITCQEAAEHDLLVQAAQVYFFILSKSYFLMKKMASAIILSGKASVERVAPDGRTWIPSDL